MRHAPIGILTLALLVATPATAQTARKGKLVPEEGAVQVMLLRQKVVREAIHLDHSEWDRIHKFTLNQWKRAREADKLGEAEAEKQFAEMTRENEQFLDQVLKPEQRKRLDQITLQVAGLLWVTRKEVASELHLTDEQIQQAKALQLKAREEVHEMVHGPGAANREEKMKELRATSRKRLMEIFTADQRARWKEMTGEPFDASLFFEPEQEAQK